MKEVKLIADKNDVLFALMPDGTYHELLVDVPGAQCYGIVGIGQKVTAEQAKEEA